jgi:hypothetical protein
MSDISDKMLPYICQSDADHHCLTCADEAVSVEVIRVDQEAGVALCRLWSGINPDPRNPTDQMEEIDITLVEDVAVGDVLLAHAGVAIAHQEKGQMHEH